MVESSDGSGKSRPGTRSSLVERAAEKLQAARGGEVKPADAAADDAGRRAWEADASPLEAVLAGAAASASAEALPGAEAAGRGKRRSKMVTIDTAALASRGIVTPETKRNRTVEEFRLIKRMVLSQRWDVRELPGNTILVTSALPAEGKTTTAVNLAMSIAAEEDVRVLLIDADFIKPDALRQLGVSANKGLIDVLQDSRMDISEVMLRTNIEKLSLIPSGQLHERCTELLASARMNEVVKELASRYEDRILIFDSPPILATTESVALTAHMGQIVFVVQAGRTKRESVDSALELIGERPNLGLVLNRSTGGFGNNDFGAYYGSYYYQYGEQQAQQADQAAE